MPLLDLWTRSFQLPSLLRAVSPFELKTNPYHKDAETRASLWFERYGVYTGRKRDKFFGHDYGSLCAWTYPDTPTGSHLETCIAFNLWLFAYDDMADESGLKKSAEGLKLGGDICIEVLKDPDVVVPMFKFAQMLQEIFKKMRATGSTGACRRFVEAFEVYTQASLCQTAHRIKGNTPTVQEFIRLRRDSSGTKLVFALIEYAMNLDIPDDIYNDASIVSLVEAAGDIVAWNNDICSFNNEQSHGDSQNAVYCAFVEKNCTLQEAMDCIAGMVRTRVEEFLVLRETLPSFDLVDVETYLEGLEHWISGSMHWYYQSKRYFISIPMNDGQVVELYQRKEDPAPLSAANVEGFSASN
ncbi:isoprenoid synthase domain-containing protein [Mycena rosella]|uniref:Terpene synthase n=1 Tax=Mycena rosella TaxID=1033263 RepID=A0AAD7DFU8_MYCRO|nr:isoprenoid synthase domain-containing protein [Mycena rosella]